MKTVLSDTKKGVIKVKLENLDDLWYLSSLIDTKDKISGKTYRKIKKGGDEEKGSVSKKAVFMTLEVEKVEFSKHSNVLRVAGIVVEGPEDVPRGSHHTFNLEEGSEIKIIKEKWLKYQLNVLKEASETKVPKILICNFDREEVYFALSKKYGYEMISSLKGEVEKKEERASKGGSFYADIIKTTTEYSKRYKLDYIVLASPAFFKEDLQKQITDEDLKKKVVLATCSSVGENAINEVLRRGEVREILRKDRISKEITLVEKLLAEISKEGLAAYGIKEVTAASEAGAIEVLLVSDKLIQKTRKEGKYEKIEVIMKKTDSMKGEVHIISSDHEGGKKLGGLSGIAAILRYKLNY